MTERKQHAPENQKLCAPSAYPKVAWPAPIYLIVNFRASFGAEYFSDKLDCIGRPNVQPVNGTATICSKPYIVRTARKRVLPSATR